MRHASVIVVLLVLGCKAKPTTEPEPTESSGKPAIANPASQHCESQGGHTEIVEGPQGQSGVCVFADGSRCEEFRFMRGSCQPSACQAANGICD